LGVVAGRNPAKAEGYFERALAVARKAGAKYWRFCAATSMAGLSRDQGRLGRTLDLASALPQLLNNANRDAHIEPRLGYDRLLVEEGLRLFQIVERVEIALLQTSRKPEKAVRELATLGPSQ
jgi:hypothetical protein